MALPDVGGGPVVPVVFWPGSGSTPIGKTNFQLFDNDDAFIDTAPQVAQWICATLGYPVVSVELQDSEIYSNLEFATMKFTSIVNEFNMRENMMGYQGMSTGSSFSQTLIRSTPLPYIIKLAADYGTEAQSGGTINIRRGFITLVGGQQDYDLQALWASVSESGNRMEIRRVFHERVPAMQRFFDPLGGGGADAGALLGAFGFSGMAIAGNMQLMPTYETLLRAQSIELFDDIRLSGYSFEIHNNKIRVWPVPDIADTEGDGSGEGDRVWFEYMVSSDKFQLTTSESGSIGRGETGVVSDFSNVPFTFVPFSDINDVGRQWIYEWTFAACKITLGYTRDKYDAVPIPNADVRLDGSKLRQEGWEQQQKLEEFLRETLKESGKEMQMEKQKKNEQNMQEILRLAPLPIYIF